MKTPLKLNSFFDKEMACDSQDKPVCPHCFKENSSDYFYEGAEEDGDNITNTQECSFCEKTFNISLDKYNQNLGYTTRPLACKKDNHKFVLEREYKTKDGDEGNVLYCKRCWKCNYQATKNGKILSRRQLQRAYRSGEAINQAFDGVKKGTFYRSEASFSLHTNEAKGNKDLFLSIVTHLKSLGYKLRDSYEMKDYPSLKHNYRHGNKNNLDFEAHYYPAGMSFDFFKASPDQSRKSRFSSDVLKECSYLDKKQLTYALNSLENFVSKDKNFTNREKVLGSHDIPNLNGLSRDQACKRILAYPRPTPTESYNRKDKDGVLLNTGDVRYAYNYEKELIRGTVIHHINSMWWLVTKDNYYNISSHELFSINGVTLSVKKKSSEKRLKEELQKAIKEENFARCVVLKKILDESKKAQ